MNKTCCASAHSMKTFLRSEEHGEQELLPGIPNEVTLALITPKLSWKDLLLLARVRRRWQVAIRAYEVYDARARAKSTETLIAHCHQKREFLALYSTSEKRCYQLSSIPGLSTEALCACHFIAMGSKLYVLRGRLCPRSKALKQEFRPELYVLDLAGQRPWEQCASMRKTRSRYRCEVMDGKLYVFGEEYISLAMTVRTRGLKAVFGGEVYDPQVNTWSSILRSSILQATTGWTLGREIATLGKELILYDGIYMCLERSVWGGPKEMSLTVYNPAKNEWRLDKLFLDTRSPEESSVFVAKEKFFLLSPSGIDVYDFDQQSWVNRYTNFFAAKFFEGAVLIGVTNVLAVNDELVMVGAWQKKGALFHLAFQCKGMDTAKEVMVWEETECYNLYHAICSILL